jgi:RNA polymerase sigma-70 factor, ECF subfamily
VFQEIIILICIEGMTYEEAGRVIEVPVGTVRSRLSRARGQLKVLIDGAEPAACPAGAGGLRYPDVSSRPSASST